MQAFSYSRGPEIVQTNQSASSQAAALLRTVALSGFFVATFVAARDSFGGDLAEPLKWLGENAVNPIMSEWSTSKFNNGWNDSKLADDWLFGWAPPYITAAGISLMVFYLLLPGFLVLYSTCLLCSLLASCVQRLVSVVGCVQRRLPWLDVNIRKQRAQAKRTRAQQAIEELLQKQPLPSRFRDVDPSLRSVVLLAWPWQGGGLLQTVALLILDIGLDIKTLTDMLSAKHYAFASVTAFIVTRSALKQLAVLPPWNLRQARLEVFRIMTDLCFRGSTVLPCSTVCMAAVSFA